VIGPDGDWQALPATPLPERRELWSAETVDPGLNGTALQVTADSAYVGGSGSVIAFDVRTGARRWRVDAPGAGAGFAASSVTLAVDDGTVYASTYGAVHAIDAASGRLRWTAPLPIGRTPGLTRVAAGAGRLCATAGSTLLGLDPASGRALWAHEVRTRFAGSPVVAGDRFLVTDGAGTTAVADDGRLLWRHDDGRVNPTDLAVADGAVYAATADDEGTLLALDLASGAVRWSAKTRQRPTSSSSPPAVTGGIVAVLSGAAVVAYDGATGAVRWQAPGRDAAVAGVGTWPVAFDGLVCSTGVDATVEAFDASTGAEAWSAPSTAPSTAPALRSVAAGPGTVLTVDGYGQVTALRSG
jgi:outer membrane protein assembly factor BamB